MNRAPHRALALLVAAATGASAQATAGGPHTSEAPDSITRAWLWIGLGGAAFQALGDSPSDPGIALMAGGGVLRGVHRFAVRGVAIAEILGDGVADVALLYGRARQDRGTRMALSGGPGLVFGEDCHGLFGGPCDETSTVVGLAGSGTLSFWSNHVVRPGLEIFGNLNSLSSFLGIVLTLEIGR